MGKNIQMMTFNASTYENVCEFPELTIDARVLLPSNKQIDSIDMQKLKQLVLEAIYASTSTGSIKKED